MNVKEFILARGLHVESKTGSTVKLRRNDHGPQVQFQTNGFTSLADFLTDLKTKAREYETQERELGQLPEPAPDWFFPLKELLGEGYYAELVWEVKP